METDAWDHFQSRLSAALKAARLSPIPSILENQVQKVGEHICIRSDAEMTEFLDALLQEVYTPPPPALAANFTGIVGPHHKWRYSSALQKAVRRNDAS